MPQKLNGRGSLEGCKSYSAALSRQADLRIERGKRSTWGPARDPRQSRGGPRERLLRSRSRPSSPRACQNLRWSRAMTPLSVLSSRTLSSATTLPASGSALDGARRCNAAPIDLPEPEAPRISAASPPARWPSRARLQARSRNCSSARLIRTAAARHAGALVESRAQEAHGEHGAVRLPERVAANVAIAGDDLPPCARTISRVIERPRPEFLRAPLSCRPVRLEAVENVQAILGCPALILDGELDRVVTPEDAQLHLAAVGEKSRRCPPGSSAPGRAVPDRH